MMQPIWLEFPDKEDAVDDWFQAMESVNIGLGFKDVVLKRALIDKLGTKRDLQVMKEAQARGSVPKEMTDRSFQWSKKETIKSLGKRRCFASSYMM